MPEEKNIKKNEEEIKVNEEIISNTDQNNTNEKEKLPIEETTRQEEDIKVKTNNWKKIISFVLVGALCAGGGFAFGKSEGRKLPATSKHYSDSKVIATVGDEKITGKQLKQRMEPLFYMNGKQALSDEQIKAYESSMIDYMTTTEVLYLEGKKEKIKASEDEINAEYENMMGGIQQQIGLAEEDYLNQFNITKEDVKKDLEKEIIATKYLGEASSVSDKEAKNYFEKNPEEFKQIRASHILIKTLDDEGNQLSDEDMKKSKKEAEEVLKKVKAGEDFATLAKEYSQDGSASNGGDLDYFAKGQMVEPFEKAAFALKTGEVTQDLVESQYGYHIIKKTDEKTQEFESVKDSLEEKLSYEKQNNTVTNLMEKYNVTVK